MQTLDVKNEWKVAATESVVLLFHVLVTVADRTISFTNE